MLHFSQNKQIAVNVLGPTYEALPKYKSTEMFLEGFTKWAQIYSKSGSWHLTPHFLSNVSLGRCIDHLRVDFCLWYSVAYLGFLEGYDNLRKLATSDMTSLDTPLFIISNFGVLDLLSMGDSINMGHCKIIT